LAAKQTMPHGDMAHMHTPTSAHCLACCVRRIPTVRAAPSGHRWIGLIGGPARQSPTQSHSPCMM
jgi:hypothetical protein